jgi:hypothetical protein
MLFAVFIVGKLMNENGDYEELPLIARFELIYYLGTPYMCSTLFQCLSDDIVQQSNNCTPLY